MNTRTTLHTPARTAIAAAIAGALLATALSACNTTEGVGKDIKAAGNGIEETARDAKD